MILSLLRKRVMTNKAESSFYTIMAVVLMFLSLIQLYLHNIEKSFTLGVIVLLILRIITLLKDEK